MKYKSLFIIIGLLFFIGTISVKAEDINSKIINGNNVLVDYDINGSVLISGFNININNKIDGVAFILGDKIDLNSNMSYALISGQDITVNGKITDAFIIGNNIILNESSNIERDIIIYGNNVEISGLINRNVKIVSDNVKIDSVQIAGDITIDSKNIEITDNSAIMGKLSYNKSAKVHISENLNNENIIVYEDNKSNKETIFNYIKNILTKIDRIRLVLNSNEIDNCSYFINQSNTSSTNPVDVQFIDTYYVSSDIITNKINIIEELLPLTIMGITYSNIPGEYTSIAMYVSDFVFKFNYDLLEDKESILNLDKLYHSNFDIPGYKNLFDINLRVIESNDSYYKDIDEVLSE